MNTVTASFNKSVRQTSEMSSQKKTQSLGQLLKTPAVIYVQAVERLE